MTQLLDRIAAAAAPHGLFDMGRLYEDHDTVVLLGANRTLWPVFQKSDEASDGAPDPLDRWSKRVIGGLAHDHDASAEFPSDGPPYAPFIAWSIATGRFWQSPTGMLIHDVAGLMISIRGAVRVSGHHAIETSPGPSPCESCAGRPCVSACPVDALSETHAYDVPTCKTHITSDAGQACLTAGCLVRRACPVSDAFGRDPVQSAFHMRSFVGASNP